MLCSGEEVRCSKLYTSCSEVASETSTSILVKEVGGGGGGGGERGVWESKCF